MKGVHENMISLDEKQKRDRYRKLIHEYKCLINVKKVCNETNINMAQIYKFTYGENTLSLSNLETFVEAMTNEVAMLNTMSQKYLNEVKAL